LIEEATKSLFTQLRASEELRKRKNFERRRTSKEEELRKKKNFERRRTSKEEELRKKKEKRRTEQLEAPVS